MFATHGTRFCIIIVLHKKNCFNLKFNINSTFYITEFRSSQNAGDDVPEFFGRHLW